MNLGQLNDDQKAVLKQVPVLYMFMLLRSYFL